MKNWMKTFVFTLCLLFSQSIIHAADISVPADQATIQAAVNAAVANDVIIVADGTYTESVDVGMAAGNITIRAANIGMATVNGGTAPAFFASGHIGDITIVGFELRSTLNQSDGGVINVTNLTGWLTVRNNTFSTGSQFFTIGINHITNAAGVSTQTTILDNSFGAFENHDFIHIEAGENGVGGDADILVDGNTNTSVIENDAVFIGLESSNTTAIVVVTNNTFGGWAGSGNGIDLFIGGGSTPPTNLEAHFLIQNNIFNNVDGDAILINFDGIGTKIFGTIDTNTITGDGVNTEDGISFDDDSSGDGIEATVFVTNNNISDITDNGIRYRPFNDDPGIHTINMVIDGNTIHNPNSDSSPLGGEEAGINISDDSGGDDERYVINVEITNNTFTSLNAVTACILIERPTSTTAGTAVINYTESGNTGCIAIVRGTPTAVADPVANSLALSSIGNFIWNDQNGNGVQDGGELGIPGVPINFTNGSLGGNTATNGSGAYFIPALTAGSYTLTITPTTEFSSFTIQDAGGNDGLDSDFDAGTGEASVVLAAGADNFTIDAGLTAIPPFVCPTVGAVSASETLVCVLDTFNTTATGLATMASANNGEQDFGIQFVAFTATPANPYTGGMGLGTVASGSLTGGGTIASLTGVTIAMAGTYEIYAILSPAPTEPTCRPAVMTSITVNIQPTATFTAFADLCVNAGTQTGLGGGISPGGVYSGTGVTDDGNGMTYSFDPAAAGVGVHTLMYTLGVAGCTDTAMDDVVVFALPTVLFTAPVDLCLDAGNQTNQTGGSPTGGLYSGPGVTDTGDGINYSFNPALAGVGLHVLTYTVSDSNGCIGFAADNVEVFALPSVTYIAPADLCVDAGVQSGLGGGTPTLGVYSGTGVTYDANGITYSFDPAAAGVGVHTITYEFSDINGCLGRATDDVEVFALPVVTFTAPTDLCLDSGVQTGLVGGTSLGGVYSGTGVTDDGNGMTYSFDPAAAGVGVHTLMYTLGIAGCTDTASDDVEVFALPVVTYTAPADLCIDAGVQTSLGGATPAGGIYSGSGVTDDGNGMTYSFDPATAGVGIHIMTYTFTDGNGCSGSATDNVEVFALPTVTYTAPADLCVDAGVQAGLGGATPAGGVYSGTGVTDDANGMTYSFDLAAAGVGVHTITYEFSDINGCLGRATDDVEVFALPTVTFTASADLCIDAGVQTGLGGGTSPGGVYSGTGVTDNGNGMTYSFDPAAAGVGVHTLMYTLGIAGCTDAASDDVEVFALPVVT
ncbi:MAG: hypothetical protein ACJAX3_001996, partial [Patiriisocius sp.]